MGLSAYNRAALDPAACAIRLVVLALYLRSPTIALAYLLAANCTYAVCILPDHDTEETRINSATPAADWGEAQVGHASSPPVGVRAEAPYAGWANASLPHAATRGGSGDWLPLLQLGWRAPSLVWSCQVRESANFATANPLICCL